MTEQQRQTDNRLLEMIQRHFPSLPLDDRYTDWQKWLGFARAAYEAGATDEREACANVCDANAKHWREMYTTANPRAAELVLLGYSAREDSAADCATNIRERSNALGEGRERGILREASSGEAATSTDGLDGETTERT